MTFLRRNWWIVAGAAACFLIAWLAMGALRPAPVSSGRPHAQERTSLSAEQVNREAHPVELAPRPGAPGSVPMALRRATSDSCEGYNIELVEAAAIETRQGRHENAARLLGMRQDCQANTSPHHRSMLR
jgi:hypothetical protein